MRSRRSWEGSNLRLLMLLQLTLTGNLVHLEENTHLHDPLNPNMLQCPNTTIEGKVGDRVILPCSTKDKMDISHEHVEWFFKDLTTGEDKDVHTYFQGEDFLHKQRDDFKNRTSLFKKELSSGNCSLSLLVTTSHSGTYSCFVPGHLRCTLTLKVLSEGKDTSQKHQDIPVSPDDPKNGLALKIGLGVCIPGAFVIFIFALGCCYREQLNNFCCRRNTNNPQTHPSVSYQAQQPPLKIKGMNQRA